MGARKPESGIIDIVRDKAAKIYRRGGAAAAASPPQPGTQPGTQAHAVALVVYDGVSPFEIGVVCDIFGGGYAEDFGVPWYRLFVCGLTSSVTLDAGFRMQVPHGLTALRSARTVIVVPTGQPDRVPASGGC